MSDDFWPEDMSERAIMDALGLCIGCGRELANNGHCLSCDSESNNLAPTNPKEKFGATKPDQTLIPPVANIYEAMVMAGGAAKYGPFNWRISRVSLRTYIAAIRRHLDAILDGQTLDPESGYPHMAHIRASAGIALDAFELGNLVDDRPPVGKAAELIAKLTRKAA